MGCRVIWKIDFAKRTFDSKYNFHCIDVNSLKFFCLAWFFNMFQREKEWEEEREKGRKNLREKEMYDHFDSKNLKEMNQRNDFFLLQNVIHAEGGTLLYKR